MSIMNAEQYKAVLSYINHVRFYEQRGSALPTDTKWWTLVVEKYDAALASFLNFTTKEEYLAGAATWKEEYTRLTKQIRQYKSARKMHQPNYDPDAWWKAKTAADEARVLLHIRAESKKRAGILRAARIAALKQEA
jgi:hypothetical protein